ncbi:MAG: energy transducer TonB [Rhodothermales bacterium]
MVVIKSASADLRRRYPLFFEIGLATSLGLAVILFTVPFETSDDFVIVEQQQEVVHVEDIEQTQQLEKPPPPPQAPAPIEVSNEAMVEEIALDFDMDLDLSETVTSAPVPPPPPPDAPAPAPEPEPEIEIFVIVENPPELIGGIQGVQDRLQYPEVARLAGLEGTVFVQFIVDERGNVVDPMCIRDPGGGTCDEALRVIRDAKFKPGRQRGKAVKVRFSLPVKFRLQ